MAEMDEATRANDDLPKVRSEHDRAMVGHAVALLDGLLPDLAVDHFPDGVEAAAVGAVIAAARFLEARFRLERAMAFAGTFPTDDEED